MSPSDGLIDWHTHCWLPEHLGAEWTAQIDGRVSRDGARLSETATPEHHQAMLDKEGIAAAAVIGLTVPSIGMTIPNEFIAEYVASDPTRLFGFASVCPGHGDAAGELRYAANDLGLRGLKLSPPYQGFHPHSDEAYEIYELAAELGMVLMFHQGAVFTSSGCLEYANPVLLDKLARDFPAMKIIIAHMGQPYFAETVAVMRKNANVFGDISARFHRPWQLGQILTAAVEYGVTDRILFGTDFPVNWPRASVEVLENLDSINGDRLPPLADDVKRDILFNRPLDLLGFELQASSSV
jgi:predicted TIM-barrel fold metal-dependent hydrolase